MRFLVVGDSHNNTQWWSDVVEPTADAVDADALIQVGDFGFWGELDDEFCATVAAGTRPVYFIDGNHEHHPLLDATVAAGRAAAGITDRTAPVPLAGALSYLPRGGRLHAGGVNICTLGGAVSIDSKFLTAGLDWFPEEHLTEGDLDAVRDGGPADVLISHDGPAGYRMPGTLPEAKMTDAWLSRLRSSEAHREMISEAVDMVRPSVVIHGHYHCRYTRTLDALWGPVRVEGLGSDGHDGALLVLNCTNGIATVSDPRH